MRLSLVAFPRRLVDPFSTNRSLSNPQPRDSMHPGKNGKPAIFPRRITKPLLQEGRRTFSLDLVVVVEMEMMETAMTMQMTAFVVVRVANNVRMRFVSLVALQLNG